MQIILGDRTACKNLVDQTACAKENTRGSLPAVFLFLCIFLFLFRLHAKW